MGWLLGLVSGAGERERGTAERSVAQVQQASCSMPAGVVVVGLG
jgi:hypothetical protein